jgi:predicted phosphodiesterase
MSSLQQANETFHEPKAIIVASDTHFGSEDCSPGAFLNFLDWLSRWQRGEVTPETSQTVELEPPEMFILLGDILELEAPRHKDLTVPLRDTLTVFNQLFDLGCKKVYVTGNHDEEMSRYSSRRVEHASANAPELNQWDYTCANKYPFIITSHHYPNLPDNKENEWVKMGNDYYIFLHGHEFDKLFILADIFKFIPSTMARLADLWSGVHPQLGGVSFVLFIGSLIVLLANGRAIHLSSTPFSALVVFILVFAFVGIPWFWVHLQLPVWKRLRKYLVRKPRDKDIKTIIEDRYFDPTKFTNPNASTIVFGHTHVPDYHTHYFGPDESIKSLWEKIRAFFKTKREPFVGTMKFINAGAWGSPAKEESQAARNTVIYIDAVRSLLFRWDDESGTLKEFDVRSTIE